MRIPLVLAATTLLLSVSWAQEAENTQIVWSTSYDAAFKQAKKEEKPVVFCIMMQGEVACDRMLSKVYKSAGFIAKAKDFVMVPCSRASTAQFPGVTVEQQRACEQKMRDTYISSEQVIAPQHIICDPDGKILMRKRYELSATELSSLLDRALRKYKGVTAPDADEEDAPQDGGEPGAKSDKESEVPDPATMDLLDSLKRGSLEDRLETARRILKKKDDPATAALVEALAGTSKTIKIDSKSRIAIIRDAGNRRNGHAALAFTKLLESKKKDVRNAAVVTLEEMKSSQAAGALLALWKKEKDTEIKKDILRALGPAGEGDEDAKALLVEQLGKSKALFRTASAMGLADHLADDEAVQDALLKRYKKESGKGKTKLAILYAFHTAKDEDAAKKLEPLIAKERVKDLQTTMDLVVADVTGREPNQREDGRGGGGGRRGGRAGRRFGGARWQLTRSFYPLFEGDKVQRNLISDLLDRFRRGR